MYRKFKHLNIPDGWEQYWSKYPNGYTIMEAIIDWVSQVDDMVTSQNILSDDVESFKLYLDTFADTFGDNLASEINKTLNEWINSGFLNVVLSVEIVEEVARINKEIQKIEDTKLTRNENESITMNMLAQDIKEAIAGGVWEFDLNTSNIADGAITRAKLSFYEPNFDNKAGIMEDGYYYDESGERVIDLSMSTTPIRNVIGGQVFKIYNTNLSGGRQAYVHFWRESMAKNGGFIADGEFTVPENSAFMRVGIATPSNQFVLIRDTENYSFNDTRLELKKPEQIGLDVVKQESTTYINKESNNLFNLTDYVPEYTYTLSGATSTTQGLGYIGFDVKPGERYLMSYVGFAQTEKGSTYITFWGDYGFISSVQAQEFTVPANAEIKIARVAIAPNYKGEPTIIKVGAEYKYIDSSTSVLSKNVIAAPQTKALISIVGDSISTYNYGMKRGNRSYYPKNDVNALNKTWWQKLVDRKYFLELLVNNSWSGSTSSNSSTGNGYPHSDGVNAVKYLSDNGLTPDIIIYQKITNDFGGNVPLEKFETDYILAITNARTYNPGATLFICTALYRTQELNGINLTLEDYNNVVRSLGATYGIQVIDFYNCGINASNASTHLIDGIHPKSSGMNLMFLKAKEVIDSFL